MPVILPTPPSDTTPPAMPYPFVWAALFVAIMAMGVAYTLLTWPKGAPTDAVWFWLRLLFFPAMAWSLLLGLRLLYVEQETDRMRAELDQWEEDRGDAVRFAQEPLALLGTAYQCGVGSRAVSETMAQGRQSIAAHQPDEGIAAIPHTRLTMLEGPLEARYETCFIDLLERLDDALCALPAGVPLEVYLQGIEPTPAPRQHNDALTQNNQDGRLNILAIWQRCWTGFGHREVPTHALPSHDSMMALDAWLDEHGGPALEKFALVVAVQLHPSPPANSAEAAVALLLGWAPLAQRKALPIDALLHRPMAMNDGTLPDTVATALLWGHAEAADVAGLWQATLDGATKTDVVKAASDLSVAACTTDGLKGVHDIDHVLGDAGIAAPWLALAFAAEHAARTGAPQAVTTRCPTLCMAVVQPAMRSDNAGSQG
ncbi:hypothetical protein EO087_10815 [Dyella sp. M7H15-1]|uniref:hypothetical protein n=1 Tax=Dyella sp. M7H15-1 TaxID=2501295 RepID=UPI001004EAAC|nr:hypothetical protein [Dyella sp. M7H15-1]QAU24420.1 hypothetical protein EO087_10815 [Dyella sp. M7H15-1]